MKESSDGFVRADQIDLKSLDDQLERHLNRAWTMEKKREDGAKEERVSREEWEIDPKKLVIKTVIARGTFGTVHRGIYDGHDVAGENCFSLLCSLCFLIGASDCCSGHPFGSSNVLISGGFLDFPFPCSQVPIWVWVS